MGRKTCLVVLKDCIIVGVLKPLNSLFDLDDSVLNRKPSKNSKSKLRTTLKLKKTSSRINSGSTGAVILKRRKSKNQLRRRRRETPENTNFSKENVFQSPPSSSTKKKKTSGTSEKKKKI